MRFKEIILKRTLNVWKNEIKKIQINNMKKNKKNNNDNYTNLSV